MLRDSEAGSYLLSTCYAGLQGLGPDLQLKVANFACLLPYSFKCYDTLVLGT